VEGARDPEFLESVPVMLDRLAEDKKILLTLSIVGAIASLIGVVLTVVGTVSIIITPTTTNWIAIATIVAILLSLAGWRRYQDVVQLSAYRYKVLNDLLTLTFSPNASRQANGAISPLLKVTSERTCTPLHNFAFEFLELRKFYRDPNVGRSDQLRDSHRCYIRCPDKFGNDNPVTVVGDVSVEVLRPYKILVPAPRGLERGERCTFGEEFEVKEEFNNDRESYEFVIGTPTKHRTIKIIFKDIEVKN
jgi:hypothetical protein